MKYPMKNKTDRPLFDYMVTLNGKFDYYLYKDFDSALKKAIELSYSSQISLIYELAFNNKTREYYGQHTFNATDGSVAYDKYADVGLHIQFYVNAGKWLNPNEEWIETLNNHS